MRRSLFFMFLIATPAFGCGATDGTGERSSSESSSVVTELAWTYTPTVDYSNVQGMSVVPEADGRLTIFQLITNGTLWRTTETAPGSNTFGAMVDTGANSLRSFAALPNADGRIEVFALGGNRVAYHVWETSPNGAWGSWQSLGGSSLQSLTAARNQDGRLEAFAVGGDGGLWHIWQGGQAGGSFGQWASLGGSKLGLMSVAPDADGSLNVFAVGGDHLLYQIKQLGPNDNFGTWTRPLYDNTTITVAIPAINADHRLELIVQRTDGELMHTWQTTPNGSYYPSYYDYGIPNVSECSTGYEADGRIVIYILQNGALMTKQQVAPNGTWSPSTGLLAGTLTKTMHAASGNHPDGSQLLVSATSFYNWGYLPEAKPNGPWATWQVNPRASFTSFSVPSADYVGEAISVSWGIKPDPLCTPSTEIAAVDQTTNEIIYKQFFTGTSGNASIQPRGVGKLLVQGNTGCTNGIVNSDSKGQIVDVTNPPPPVCNGGSLASYTFCATWPPDPILGSTCFTEVAQACSYDAAETGLKAMFPQATITDGTCPNPCE